MLAFLKHMFTGGKSLDSQKRRLATSGKNLRVAADREKANLLTKLANSEVTPSTKIHGSATQQRMERLNQDWHKKMSSFETAFRIDS